MQGIKGTELTQNRFQRLIELIKSIQMEINELLYYLNLWRLDEVYSL